MWVLSSPKHKYSNMLTALNGTDYSVTVVLEVMEVSVWPVALDEWIREKRGENKKDGTNGEGKQKKGGRRNVPASHIPFLDY